MRLSTRGRYALRAMIDLALHADEGPVPRSDIAERQEVSAHYIEQLFVKLRRAGFIESVRGPESEVEMSESVTQKSSFRDSGSLRRHPLVAYFVLAYLITRVGVSPLAVTMPQ